MAGVSPAVFDEAAF